MTRDISRRAFMRGAAAASVVPVLGTAGLLGAQPPAAESGRLARRLRARDFVVEASYALLWRNGRAEVVPDAYVRVRGNDIVAVGTGRVRGTMERLTAHGQLLLPGFISGHTHAASGSPTRGLIEGGRSYQRPIELVEQLPSDLLDALTAYNVAELMRSGCTTHVEMSLSLRQAQSYVRVARQWHVRGFPGGMVPGTARLFPIWRRANDAVLTESVPATLAEIEANRVYALSVRGAEDGLIMPMMTPHAADTHTPETMQAVVAAANELGTGIHTHLAQGSGEVRTVQRLHGVTPTRWLAAMGAFKGPFFGAHMTAATPDDWTFLMQQGGVYVHCPSGGGAGNSSGSQPYPEALAAGVATNVGIDTHSNDYVENLKLAVICGRARARLVNQLTGSRIPLPSVMQAVAGATHGAADGLRRPDLGRLTVGAKADLCSIDVGGLLVGSGVAGPEPLHNLLYANGHSVRHVFTQGYAQVLHGQLVVANEQQLLRDGAKVAQTIWAQLRAEGWFT